MFDQGPTDYICAACQAAQTAQVQPLACPHCGAAGSERAFPTKEIHTIAGQNDRFRKSWGSDPSIPGQIYYTNGIAAFGDRFLTKAMGAIRAFDAFTEDNDPMGERSFAVIEVPHIGKAERIFWKIDLYDLTLEYGSPVPADPRQTMRVLTILLPSEY